eukprot:TRINITY_DN3588_c0_g1_i1.p1 TRINITY_DN3588_c0_g1~~TRINITY_DN3588_c0_g1_i1.p1  ORF type:complete len:232 (+),score=53.76 TRINITY_DN3588_c0_g1_i1:91-696(+)
MGGMLQYVECTVNTGDKVTVTLKTTGSMGDVISESTSIAYTYAKNYLSIIDPNNKYFEKSIHLHFPAGAIPKDGPSAGVSVVTALLSLALNIGVKDTIAMTGEITLSGKILDVQAIKEKIIAAHTTGITEVILPSSNHAEWDELDPILTSGITVHFVSTYDDIFKLSFPDYDLTKLKKKNSKSTTQLVTITDQSSSVSCSF